MIWPFSLYCVENRLTPGVHNRASLIGVPCDLNFPFFDTSQHALSVSLRVSCLRVCFDLTIPLLNPISAVLAWEFVRKPLETLTCQDVGKGGWV